MQETKGNLIKEKPKITTFDDRYNTLFERINAAAFLTSFDGQIQEANQKSYEFLGYDWNELLRLTLQDILSKELDWAECRDELAAHGCLTLESETICKDGTQFPVDVNISIFRMNGKLVMFVLLWDITERKNQEKRLKESEKKYHGLFEYTTDGIFVLDTRGDILDINTRMCEILDVMKSSVLNKNLFSMDLLTARSLPVVIQQFEQLLSEKIAASYTTEVKNRQGQVLDVEISSFFLVKKDNEVDNFVLIVRDITSRNEAELKRTWEHELLKTLMDNVPDSVYFKDDQNRFILVNKAKAAHSNVTPEEMMGKTDFDFLPREQAQRIVDDENAIMRSGHVIINKLEHLGSDDGLERWVSVTKIPRYNAEGDIIGTMGVSRDVTDWKHAEEELARNIELLQILLDNIPDSVYFKDMQNQFVLVNKVKAEHLMVRPEAMIGKTDFDFIPADQAQKEFDEDNKVLQTGKSIINCIEKITDTDGAEHWYSVTKVPRYDLGGKIIGTLGISRNVTECKTLQEIKQ
ncbi:MAG: PAS domain S-box protein [Thermoplasmata archaeon]|nr:PAS domain S-box protein [Thermoplasmata archaeon]MBE3142111.1 PAS domain S-box protein [Thermoplasmata archaeon]